MKKATRLFMLALVALSAACSKEAAKPTDPTDTTVTPPPPPPPPPPPGGQTAVLIGAGNVSMCSNNYDELTAKIIDTMTTATVVVLGNAANASTGTMQGRTATYTSCYEPTWGRFKGRTYYAMGNHDYDSTNSAADAFAYWGDRAGPAGKGYYSFNAGSWHVVVLNTENAATVPYESSSDQQAWLGTDLSANASAKCTLAIFHRTRFQSTRTTNADGSPFFERTTLASLWGRLLGGGVDVVLNGGNSFYERMLPLNAAGGRDDATGVIQFNVGTGGEGIFAPTFTHPQSAKIGTDFGVLKLTLRPDSYDYQFIPISGAAFTDSGSGTCR